MVAIRREESSVWERRAPLSPYRVHLLVKQGVKVLVQPSNRRAYSMLEYEKEGATITDDVSSADIILGVKRPILEDLIPDKTYIFFSHTIKAQPENMDLLDALLEKRIRLVDYECILDSNNRRIVAFGKFAGMCGMINILHGLGIRLLALGHHTPFMYIGSAHNYSTTIAAKAAIAILGREIEHSMMPQSLAPMIFTFSGSGNVSQGAQEIFSQLPHEYVSPDSLEDVVRYGDTRKVYGTVVGRKDHLVRNDGGPYNKEDYNANPTEYKATFFEKIARYTTCLVNGVFWAPGTPKLITSDQFRELHPRHFDATALQREGVPDLPQRLLVIADISNDANGSLELGNYTNTTIDNPFIMYNAHTDGVSKELSGNGLLMMSVDNLPAQFPREATEYFGSKLFPLLQDCLKVDGTKPLEECDLRDPIRNAFITYNGRLTSRFQYIEKLRHSNNSTNASLHDLMTRF